MPGCNLFCNYDKLQSVKLFQLRNVFDPSGTRNVTKIQSARFVQLVFYQLSFMAKPKGVQPFYLAIKKHKTSTSGRFTI